MWVPLVAAGERRRGLPAARRAGGGRGAPRPGVARRRGWCRGRRWCRGQAGGPVERCTWRSTWRSAPPGARRCGPAGGPGEGGQLRVQGRDQGPLRAPGARDRGGRRAVWAAQRPTSGPARVDRRGHLAGVLREQAGRQLDGGGDPAAGRAAQVHADVVAGREVAGDVVAQVLGRGDGERLAAGEPPVGGLDVVGRHAEAGVDDGQGVAARRVGAAGHPPGCPPSGRAASTRARSPAAPPAGGRGRRRRSPGWWRASTRGP